MQLFVNDTYMFFCIHSCNVNCVIFILLLLLESHFCKPLAELVNFGYDVGLHVEFLVCSGTCTCTCSVCFHVILDFYHI